MERHLGLLAEHAGEVRMMGIAALHPSYELPYPEVSDLENASASTASRQLLSEPLRQPFIKRGIDIDITSHHRSDLYIKYQMQPHGIADG